MAKKRYWVWIPAILQSRFGGQKTLSEYFEDTETGKLWRIQKTEEFQRAKRAARDQREDARVGDIVKSQATLREVAGGWSAAATELKPSSKAWYLVIIKAHLYPSWRDTFVSAIGRAAIEEHMARREKAGASKDARKKDLVVLRVLLNWARGSGIAVDPTAWEVKRPKPVRKVTRRYDPEMMAAFLAALSGRDRVALEVAAATGFRAGELRAMRIEWIRWQEGRIHLPSDMEFSPKNSTERSVPLLPDLERMLREWTGVRKTGLVFPPVPGRGGKGIYLRGIIAKARKATGLPITGMHDLRHHYASWLLNKGVDRRTVQEIMGHSSGAVLDGYSHAAPDYFAQARAKVGQRATATPGQLTEAVELAARIGRIAAQAKTNLPGDDIDRLLNEGLAAAQAVKDHPDQLAVARSVVAQLEGALVLGGAGPDGSSPKSSPSTPPLRLVKGQKG